MNLKMILVSAIFILLTACTTVIPKGDVVIREREVAESFDRVEVSSGLRLSLIDEVKTTKVQVRTVENIHDYIETFVEGRTLIVRFRPKVGIVGVLSDAEIFVPASVLKGVSASGGAEVNTRTTLRNSVLEVNLSGGSRMLGTIETPDLSINLSGGSKMEGSIVVNNLKCEVSGGARVELSGTAVNGHVDVSGGAKVLGFGLVIDDLYVNLSGGSRTELSVKTEIKAANLSGGSAFVYDGNPKIDYNAVKNSGGSSFERR